MVLQNLTLISHFKKQIRLEFSQKNFFLSDFSEEDIGEIKNDNESKIVFESNFGTEIELTVKEFKEEYKAKFN